MAKSSNTKLVVLLNRAKSQNSSNDVLNEMFKRHDEKTVDGLVLDLRRDASNTVGRFLTGPVDYDECVRRVAVKVGVSEGDLTDDEEKNEMLVLQICLKKYFEKLDPAEREAKELEILNEIGAENKEIFSTIVLGSSTALLAILQRVGPAIIGPVVLRSMAIFAGGQLALSTARLAALAVPFLNVIMALWMAWDIAGPAYRKIIPSVLNIALLRLEAAIPS